MSSDPSILATNQEKKQGFLRWMNKFAFDLFFIRKADENRSEIFQILGRELILSPLYKKVPYTISETLINPKQMLISKIRTMSYNNLLGKYNKPEELMSLAECFNYMNSKLLFCCCFND